MPAALPKSKWPKDPMSKWPPKLRGAFLDLIPWRDRPRYEAVMELPEPERSKAYDSLVAWEREFDRWWKEYGASEAAAKAERRAKARERRIERAGYDPAYSDRHEHGLRDRVLPKWERFAFVARHLPPDATNEAQRYWELRHLYGTDILADERRRHFLESWEWLQDHDDRLTRELRSHRRSPWDALLAVRAATRELEQRLAAVWGPPSGATEPPAPPEPKMVPFDEETHSLGHRPPEGVRLPRYTARASPVTSLAPARKTGKRGRPTATTAERAAKRADDAAKVLRALATRPEGLSFRALVKVTKLDNTRLRRALDALQSDGCVEHVVGKTRNDSRYVRRVEVLRKNTPPAGSGG